MADLDLPKPDLSTFLQKVAEKKAREEAALAAKAAEAHDTDLIPDAVYERTDEDIEFDEVVNRIGIVDAYRKWCGKSPVNVRPGQTESIKVSCPTPEHTDAHPSAWLNTEKNTWFCGNCQQGGDTHDIAAFHFGYPVPGYKEGALFGQLRDEMAASFGYHRQILPGGITVVQGPDPDENDGAAPSSLSPAQSTGTRVNRDESDTAGQISPEADSDIAPVVSLYDDSDLDDIVYPTIDWHSLLPEDTFLRKYMECTTIDEVTEEFHFWNGMLALGAAVGRQVRLNDGKLPVLSNLFICTLGRSGSGKSRAQRHLEVLLDEVLPYSSDPTSKGMKIIRAPASGEVLISAFQKAVYDPLDPKKIVGYVPVRGLVDFNELAGLVARSQRQGNTLENTLQDFYDGKPVVSSTALTTGEKEARDAFASCVTTSQPLSLKRLITIGQDESGFLNRWLFIGGKPKDRIAWGSVLVDIAPAKKPLSEIHGWASSFHGNDMVTVCDEGIKLWVEFFHRTLVPTIEKSEDNTNLLNRLELLMKKLILLFAINRKEKVASEQTVKDALSLWDYLMVCYMVPEKHMGRSLEDDITDAIMYQVKRLTEVGAIPTIATIAKALKGRKYPKDLIIKNIDNLVKLGFLNAAVTSEPGRKGPKTVKYSLNDSAS